MRIFLMFTCWHDCGCYDCWDYYTASWSTWVICVHSPSCRTRSSCVTPRGEVTSGTPSPVAATKTSMYTTIKACGPESSWSCCRGIGGGAVDRYCLDRNNNIFSQCRWRQKKKTRFKMLIFPYNLHELRTNNM